MELPHPSSLTSKARLTDWHEKQMCQSCLLLADKPAVAVPTSFLHHSAGLVLQQKQAGALLCQDSGWRLAPRCWSSPCPTARGTAGTALLSWYVTRPSLAFVTLHIHTGHGTGFGHKIDVSGGGSNGWKQISCRKCNATARGCQTWGQSGVSHWSLVWAPHLESVILPHPRVPAWLPLFQLWWKRAGERVFHSFTLKYYSCTNFVSLPAENRRRWALWQKLLKPFKCNDVLTKNEVTRHLWGFHFTLNIFLLSLPSCSSDWELLLLEQVQDRHGMISPVWSEVSGGCYVVPSFDTVEMVLKSSQLNREIYGDRCCSQCSTMKVVVPWNLRYPPEPLEVDDNCVSLAPECLSVGETAKHGHQNFLLRVRLEHECREWDPQELVTNIANKTLMQVNDAQRCSLESLMSPLINCAWAVILAAHWISETTVCTAY